MDMVEWGRMWIDIDDLVFVQLHRGLIWERGLSWMKRLSLGVVVRLF
jgi:hypothetical protein